MRKQILSIISILLFIPGFVFAIDWHVADQGTFKWLSVTTMDNGEKLPNDAIIKYQVYLKNLNTGEMSFINETEELQATVTFPNEGKYITGIKAIRYLNENIVNESKDISWGDDPRYSPVPFGFTFYMRPAQTEGIEKKE